MIDRLQHFTGRKTMMPAPLCAMGSSMLRTYGWVDENRERRNKIYSTYADAFEDKMKFMPHDCFSCFHAFILLPDDREEFVKRISDSVQTVRMYPPASEHPWCKNAARGTMNADEIGKKAVAIPAHAGLSDDDVKSVIKAVMGACT